MKYAGFWRRLFAGFIDFLVLSPLLALWLWSISWSSSAVIFSSIASFIGINFYTIYFLTRYGQTIGKMFCSIKVVDLSGAPLTQAQAFNRHFVDIILGLVGLITFYNSFDHSSFDTLVSWSDRIGFLNEGQNKLSSIIKNTSDVWYWSEFVVLLVNEKRRAIHDFIAGSVVICETKDRAE